MAYEMAGVKLIGSDHSYILASASIKIIWYDTIFSSCFITILPDLKSSLER